VGPFKTQRDNLLESIALLSLQLLAIASSTSQPGQYPLALQAVMGAIVLATVAILLGFIVRGKIVKQRERGATVTKEDAAGGAQMQTLGRSPSSKQVTTDV
jgi:hypothetical protein